MGGVLEWLEREGLATTHMLLTVAPLLASIWIGVKAAQRWNKITGWIIGLGSLVVLFAMFYPVVELIERRGCELNPDFEDCY
jgi:Na+-transporting NADH:ubiquinone oxidoreductase subunit NqrB